MKLPFCLLLVSFLLLVSGSSTDPREDRDDLDRGQEKKRSHSAEPFARNVRARVDKEQGLLTNPEEVDGLSALPSDVLRYIMGLTGIESFLSLQGMNLRFKQFFKETPTLELLFAAFQEKVLAGDGASIFRLLPFVAKYYRTERGVANKQAIFSSLSEFFYHFHFDLSKTRPSKSLYRLLRDFFLHELENPRFTSPVIFEALAPIAVKYLENFGFAEGFEEKKRLVSNVARVIAQTGIAKMPNFYRVLFAIKTDLYSLKLSETFTNCLILACNEIYDLDGPTAMPFCVNQLGGKGSELKPKKASKLSLPLLVAGNQTVQEDILIWEYSLFDICKVGRVFENPSDILPLHPLIGLVSRRMAEMAALTYHFLATVQNDEFWGKHGQYLWDRLNERIEAFLDVKLSYMIDESFMVAELNRDFNNTLFSTILKTCAGLYIVDEAAIQVRLTALANRRDISGLAGAKSLPNLLGWLSACWVPFKALPSHELLFPSQTDDLSLDSAEDGDSEVGSAIEEDAESEDDDAGNGGAGGEKIRCVDKLPVINYPQCVLALSSGPKSIQSFFINLCHRHVRLQSIAQSLKAVQSLSAYLIHSPFQAVFDQVVITDLTIFLEPLLFFIPKIPTQVQGTPLYLVEAFSDPLLGFFINLVASQPHSSHESAVSERAFQLWNRFFRECLQILRDEASPQRKAKALQKYHALMARYPRVRKEFGNRINVCLPDLSKEFPEALRKQ